jgi:hypothetical protein
MLYLFYAITPKLRLPFIEKHPFDIHRFMLFTNAEYLSLLYQHTLKRTADSAKLAMDSA